ncbi:MAG TPA: hypothetical protein VI653_27105 [Steroidobacteraceae bacterium]
MSGSNAKHRPRRTRKARHGGHRPSDEDFENIRLSLLAVVATCTLVRSSFAASRCTGIVLTRGVLQPLREVLTLLGESDPEFSTPKDRGGPRVSRERRA